MEELIQVEAIENIEIAELELAQGNRIFIHREDPFENLNDRMFVKIFRLSKDLVRQLLDILDEYIEPPRRRSSLSKQTKVLVALQFFASGSYQNNVGYNPFCGVSQASVSRCITEITNALNEEAVMNAWIRFPGTQIELDNTRRRFYDKFGLPGVIGSIDCTHVAIFPPRQNYAIYPEHIYINRKNYHSINVQLICDADLRITNINARFPGSTHDSHIWHNSNVHDAVVNLNRRNPEYYLIGDSGYPLRPWLQTPIRNPEPGTPEFRYNIVFKRARSIIEQCNGLLKMRFRCLLKHRVLHYSPTVCSKIINACAILHNMCVQANIPIPENENVDFEMFGNNVVEPELVDGPRQNPDLIAARIFQQRIIQNYFR